MSFLFLNMLQQGVVLVLSCVGLFQSIFLVFYLFNLKSGNKEANKLLALVLLALTIRIGKSVLHHYVNVSPWFRNLAISSILTVGPLIWMYGKVLFKQTKIDLTKVYPHFAPFFLFVLFSYWIPNRGDTASYLAYLSVFTHLGIYLIYCLNEFIINKGSTSIKLLGWYRQIWIGISLIWAVFIAIFFKWIPFYILGAVFFSFLTYLFTYLLLKKHTFVLQKYATSNIDLNTSKKLLEKIKNLFEKEEVFLNTNISLNSLAKRLEVSSRELSQVINEMENRNFSEFVNFYRIEKAKSLLIHPKYNEEKIATIAYDSGFGNVTSFNLAFKAFTQMTPSQYKNRFALGSI